MWRIQEADRIHVNAQLQPLVLSKDILERIFDNETACK